MPYKNPRPIAKIIKEVFNTTPYHHQWLTSKIRQACKLALPFLEGKIRQFYIKKSILYIKLDSALLSQELRLNKTKVIMRIQDACKTLGEKIVIENVVFL